ncbi:DNA glycosylase AlkZ-like family protein [Arthrobacter sp. STN4]|uniref:DNA glycosylase AlkZ-like family protein n=1 Tax=Arthrobacter sp. STN4 TaxID=2923276 RepID=UPI00211A8F74|nr:crosslink repair DNA glycosylase YcaQ family protein [Arthrobacter sp. STN4]MCQ9164994.1 winged helix DNA-binding domain-containing protein [Arthrobacter sp. STN4]
MDNETQRAWSWHKQGLDGSLAGQSAAQVLGAAGWARSVGGANPYLTLFARAGIRRDQADADVAALRIHELPTARGCTYVLGAGDFAWALSLGQGAAEAQAKVLDKLDVPRSELAALEGAVLEALGAGVDRQADGRGAMDPQQLKAALGDAVRSLGEAGKKKGASTTLPAVLGLLQADGRIRRVPVNGRLDQQRYAYTAWGLAASTLTPEQTRARLMECYLGWTGGAGLKQTQWFTGFTVAQTKAALAGAGAVDVDGLWILPADADERENFAAPKEEQVRLLAGSDSLFLLRRNAADHFAPEDQGRRLGSTRLALQADLPDHPIVDRGRIIGLWQYDPGEGRMAHWLFNTPTKAVKHRIKEVEAFIREDLGDFRSFSLDSPSSRQKRIDALDAAG